MQCLGIVPQDHLTSPRVLFNMAQCVLHSPQSLSTSRLHFLNLHHHLWILHRLTSPQSARGASPFVLPESMAPEKETGDPDHLPRRLSLDRLPQLPEETTQDEEGTPHSLLIL